jgi:biopolymer transport protein ExbD
MAMQVGSGGGENEPMIDINTTPLIDVMLVLLIMLILTIPPMFHAVKLDMPRPDQPPPPTDIQPVVIAVEVDFDGTLSWNGETIDRAELERRLAIAANQNPQPELHIRPNKLAEYKYVAAVMASAQRLGVIKIGVIQAG